MLLNVSSVGILLLATVLLVKDLEHLLLHVFLLKNKSILIPNEIRCLGVNVVLLHAAFEQIDDEGVVWILGKGQIAAVVHELSELFWAVLAKVFDSDFLLLFLNVSILFFLGSTWETLPWKLTFQEVKEHMANSLQVISS